MNNGTNSGSRYSLFLMEQLIVITIFAVCASVCVKIFSESYLMASASKDMNYAIIRLESAAECYKAFGGDLSRVSEMMNGNVQSDGATVFIYYDADWAGCAEEAAAYVIKLESRDNAADENQSLVFCDISAEKIDGAPINDISIAARRRVI